jgi:hypothetical protein
MVRQGARSVYRFAVPLSLLLVYAGAFGAVAFGLSLPGVDDHPGQLYRLGHALERGAWPWTWNPEWWAGYPELQFYPPGFFYAGLMAHWLTLGIASVGAIYQALLWITWLAPGLTAYALLARLTGSGWAALPGAFLALTLSAGTASGVQGAVNTGMLPARLAIAMLPGLALVLGLWIEGRRNAVWLSVPLVAALTITHPTHLPGAVTLVLLAAVQAARTRGWRAALPGAWAMGLAAAWTAFWALPLVARLEHTRPLAWGHLAVGGIVSPLGLALVALAVAGAFLARRPGERLLARWPWAMLAVVGADALGLEPLGVRWLPADRVDDTARMAAALAAGLAIARLVLRPTTTRVPPAALAGLAIAVLAILATFPRAPITTWPGAPLPTLASVQRGLRLDALWQRLAGGPARALFTRSGVPLVYGTEWWRPHSHATALTPLHGQRPIVHGTFTHPSPVAALVYRGTAAPGAIDTLAERLDGQSLFGRPLEALDGVALEHLTDRLGVGTVIVLDEDLPRFTGLEGSAAFVRRPPVGPFTLYERRRAPRIPVQVGPDHWRIDVPDGNNRWVPARLTYYPLWRAERAGAPLPTRRGEAWDLEVEVPGPGPVDLFYAPGAWEKAGVTLSAAGLLTWIALVVAARRHPPRPSRPPPML